MALGKKQTALIKSMKNEDRRMMNKGQLSFDSGYKQYELSNHLPHEIAKQQFHRNCISRGKGNFNGCLTLVKSYYSHESRSKYNEASGVLVTIQDRKWGIQTTGGNNANYYLPYIITTSDYYAFGSSMVERSQSFGEIYKFGFNNQEKEGDPDSNREGDYYSFEYRIHDSRLGRFLSVDPLSPEYPWNSCYAFAENRVIDCLDLEGLEAASGTVMITGGDGAVKSPNQHTVYGKTTANQRLNQQSFLQSELNRLTGSEWKPANGKYDKNWFENVYKPNAQAINAFLDKPASTIINNPTQSTSTVTSTPTTAASTSTTTTATSPNPTSVATSSSVSTSTTTAAVTGDPISSTVSSVSSKVSTAGVVLGAVETVDRFGYVTSAGKFKTFSSSTSKIVLNDEIVKMRSIGGLRYVNKINVEKLNQSKIVGGPQKVIGSALGRTGLSIDVGKYMGPIGVGLSFVNMFAEPTAKNFVGFAFDITAYVFGIGCPPLGFAISAVGWVTGKVWPEPEKPVVKKTPSPLYPSTTKPLNFSTSTSVSPTYMYTPSRIRRMPSDHMNPYSPAGGYY